MTVMELATCNDIELLAYSTVQVGVANSTARGGGSCDTVRLLGLPTDCSISHKFLASPSLDLNSNI
jgi:hypothetical protein